MLGRSQAQQGVIKKWKAWFILVVFVFRLKSILRCFNWKVLVRGLPGSSKDLLGCESGSQGRQRGIRPSPLRLPPICYTQPWRQERGLKALWITAPHHPVSTQCVGGRLVTQDGVSCVLRELQIITKQYYSLMIADLSLWIPQIACDMKDNGFLNSKCVYFSSRHWLHRVCKEETKGFHPALTLRSRPSLFWLTFSLPNCSVCPKSVLLWVCPAHSKHLYH